MTLKQRRVLDAIKALTVDGICPSFEAIMAYCGFSSKSPVHAAITALERQGYLHCPVTPGGKKRMARAMTVVRFDGEVTDEVLDAMPRPHLWALYAKVSERLGISA